MIRKEGNYLFVDRENGTWATGDESHTLFLNKLTGNDSKSILQLHRELLSDMNIDLATTLNITKKFFLSGLIKVNGKSFISFKDLSIDTQRYPVLGIIHMSNNCNLKCRYCYAHPEDINRKSIALKTIKKAIYEMLALPNQKVYIEFHGGEPLVHFQKITQAVRYGFNVARSLGKKIKFKIQSNGILIKDDVIDFFKEQEIVPRISLDGPAYLNDKYRIFPTGRGSHQEVMEAIKRMQLKNLNFDVVVVVTKESIDRIAEIVDFFINNRIYSLRFIPVWLQGRAASINDISIHPLYFAEKYFCAIKKIAEYNKTVPDSEKIRLPNLKYMIKNIITRKRDFMCLRSPCGAGIDMINFSIDGDVYPCEEMNERRELRIGNIYKDSLKNIIDNSHLIKRLKTRTVDVLEKCSICIWKRFCGGGCSNKVHLYYGTFERESEYCEFYQYMFENLMWYISRDPIVVRYLI